MPGPTIHGGGICFRMGNALPPAHQHCVVPGLRCGQELSDHHVCLPEDIVYVVAKELWQEEPHHMDYGYTRTCETVQLEGKAIPSKHCGS